MKHLLTSKFLLFFFLLIISTSIVAAILIGDANNDGRVDGKDYIVWLNHFGQNASGPSNGDFDNNGTVNENDYIAWQNNYGSTGPTISPSPTPTRSPTPSPTRSPTPGPTNSTGQVSCSSLSGIERRFPCSPIVAGPMPEKPSSGSDKWDMFTNSLYPGVENSNGINERFSAVANPSGPGAVIKNQNLLADAENHTTVGTARDMPLGSTECSAFRWLWKDATEFPQRDWVLVWQQQQIGSPIVAIQVENSTDNWFFKTRNGADSGHDESLGHIQYGHWAYFVVCTHIAESPNGWTQVWFQHDGWPNVNSAPFYERRGIDTHQASTSADDGHNTIGIYAGGDYAGTSYYGYFDRYGRATTPQRAVQIAGDW